MKPSLPVLHRAILCLCALGLLPSLSAQNQDRPQPTMEERNARMLERFPEADANKDGELTREEAMAFLRKRRGENGERPPRNQVPAPTHADVKYGEHKQQAFDIWLAEPAVEGSKTPLCLFIHGGGFRGGDKSKVNASSLDLFLSKGISFASINYRLSNGGEFPYPTAMEDSAYALQLIRSKAEEWNIDPTKIVSHGGSAGAGISLWLAFHEDLADPDAEDPVKRQSTRLLAAGTMNGQSSYDMRTLREWYGIPDLPTEVALWDFYAMKEGETPDTPRVAALAEQASALTHLTADDPPVYMLYGRPNTEVTPETSNSVWIHHPIFGLKLQEAMTELGLECIVTVPEMETEDPYGNLNAFLIQKLTE